MEVVLIGSVPVIDMVSLASSDYYKKISQFHCPLSIHFPIRQSSNSIKRNFSGIRTHFCLPTGILCGSCKKGSGFSAILSRCVSCSNFSALLIVTLGIYNLSWLCSYPILFSVIADTVIYIVLILLSLQFPAWLFPCLFHFQVFEMHNVFTT